MAAQGARPRGHGGWGRGGERVRPAARAQAVVQRLTARLDEASGLLTVDGWYHRVATLAFHAANAVARGARRLSSSPAATAHARARRLWALCGAVLRAARVGGDARTRHACAFIAAAWWAAHPAHAEVVAWASAQPYAPAALLVLLALRSHVAVVEADGAAGAALRAAGPALYLAATLCKSVVVPAPAAVAALDATLLARRAGAPRLLRRVAATTARDLAGYAAVAAVVVPVTLRANALGHDPDADVIVLHTGAQRCAKALVTIWFCLGKAAYPAGLSPHYALRDLYFEAGHDDGEARLALACFVATTAGCAALALAGLDGGAALAAWVYVVAAFLPTCGLVQHGMVQKGGDRYLYLPTLGLAVLGAVAVAVAGDRARGSGSGASTSGAGATSAPPPPAPVAPVPPRRRAAAAAAVAVAAAALVAALVDATAALAPAWRDDVPLLERCLRVDADDWRCLDTYAEYLMARGDRGDTARDLMARGLAAVERLGVPESPKTLVFRGKALVMLGELDAGCALFDRCVERFPHAGFAWIDAGICALRDPARREAQEATFEKALALARRPEHVDAARANLAEFRRWRDSGWAGTFDGTLVY